MTERTTPTPDVQPALDAIRGKTVLITGGSGSFGRALARRLLGAGEPEAVRIFSRDEYKQYTMRADFDDDPRLRFFIGDVRDRDRLSMAFRGVDLVVHAAAMKQVPACEYNPFEAVQTNIMGSENVLAAAIAAGVPRVVALSTDKAVNPANLYGATKLCAEKVMLAGQVYAADTGTRVSCVRYGNVVGSRGSVVPLFLEQAAGGTLTITDERMTRFWITLDQAVDFVLTRALRMTGGEVFVPKIPSMRIVDLARVIAPEAAHKVVGIRPGEKLHEALLTVEESRHTVEVDDSFVVLTADAEVDGRRVREGFVYTSDANDWWVTDDEARVIVDEFLAAGHHP